MLAFRGVPVSLAGRATINHQRVVFLQGLSSQADPHPLSLRQPRQAGGAGEWWLEVQCSRGDEAVFTAYFSLRL